MSLPDPTRDSTGAAADDNYYTEPKHISLTLEDVASLLIIASQVDPDNYNTDAARAMIYKAKSVVASRGDTTTFRGTISVSSPTARQGW